MDDDDPQTPAGPTKSPSPRLTRASCKPGAQEARKPRILAQVHQCQQGLTETARLAPSRAAFTPWFGSPTSAAAPEWVMKCLKYRKVG